MSRKLREQALGIMSIMSIKGGIIINNSSITSIMIMIISIIIIVFYFYLTLLPSTLSGEETSCHERRMPETYGQLSEIRGSVLNRHRLNGYLAEWVPSPPGKYTFKNFTS